MLSPRCNGCLHNDNGCAVGVCAAVRSDLHGMGVHVLPMWRGELVPKYAKGVEVCVSRHTPSC